MVVMMTQMMKKKLKLLASLLVIVSAQLSGNTSNYPQSTHFGSLIDPNINPLRDQSEFGMINEMVNTASYISTQVTNAQASVIEMATGVPESAINIEGLIVPVAGRTDSHKIDLTEIGYYNQSIVDTANSNFMSAQHLLHDTYEDQKDLMKQAINQFTEVALEISKSGELYDRAVTANTDALRIDLQNYIRSNDTQIKFEDAVMFNESLDAIEDYAQGASAMLWASQDPAVLGMINSDHIRTLSNITESTATYDAWSDTLEITWNNAVNNTAIQGIFFTEGALNWQQAVDEVYDNYYNDMPETSLQNMYSSYGYGSSEAVASMGQGYVINAKLYDPAQLQIDLITITNEEPTTQYNNLNGNLGGIQ
jgi:hypothetical protein